jgi:hypothetical protein
MMTLGVTLYIVTTLILFSLNTLSNIVSLAFADKKEFPVAIFIATMFSIIFVIWGITLLVVN